MRVFVAAVCAVVCLASPELAAACGVSSPGAPAGVCDASDALDAKAAAARSYRVGLSGSYTTTAMWLSDGARLDMQRQAVVATLSLRLSRSTNLEFGAGAIAGGSLGSLALRPGGLASASASWRVVEQRGAGTPFVLLTAAASFMAASTGDGAAIGAADVRAGGAIGTTLGRAQHATLTPYFAGQLFGGPTFWAHDGRAVTGTDIHKFAVGGGLAGSVGRFGLYAGGALLGERSLSIGVSAGF